MDKEQAAEKPAASGAKPRTVAGYMCMIDWDHELGHAPDGNRVYPSVKALKQHHDCWAECGIVRVHVTFAGTVVEELWDGYREESHAACRAHQDESEGEAGVSTALAEDGAAGGGGGTPQEM